MSGPSERPMAADGWGAVLGLKMLEVTPQRVTASLEPEQRHQQPYGILHGGVYCSIVEAVASYGAAQAAPEGVRGVVGTSNQTDFLRSHGRGALDVVGEPLYVGRTQQLWEVRIRRRSDGQLVARGQVRFSALTELPAERGVRE